MHQFFPCRSMPFGHRLRYTVENIFELYLLELQLYFRQKKKRIARCECCWQYFIPKTSAETHYCDRVIDGLSCKALGPKLKGKDGAALDEALRIYNALRHRMEERRNRYEDAPPDQRDRLKPVSDARYQEWISAAVKVRGRYLKGKISASDFLREIDSFGKLETYKVEQVSLPEPNRRHGVGISRGIWTLMRLPTTRASCCWTREKRTRNGRFGRRRNRRILPAAGMGA